MYSTVWTQFETQSLLFGVLRKELYPKYLIRGDFGKIVIYQPTANPKAPILLLTLRVYASTTPDEVAVHNMDKLGETNTLAVIGGTNVNSFKEWLLPELARAEGGIAAPSPI